MRINSRTATSPMTAVRVVACSVDADAKRPQIEAGNVDVDKSPVPPLCSRRAGGTGQNAAAPGDAR
jgi:hypothetical protein